MIVMTPLTRRPALTFAQANAAIAAARHRLKLVTENHKANATISPQDWADMGFTAREWSAHMQLMAAYVEVAAATLEAATQRELDLRPDFERRWDAAEHSPHYSPYGWGDGWLEAADVPGLLYNIETSRFRYYRDVDEEGPTYWDRITAPSAESN